MNLLKTLLEDLDAIMLFELAESKAKFLVKQQKAGLLKAVAKDSSGVLKTLVKHKDKPEDEELEQVVIHLSKISEKHLQWLVNKYCQLQGSDKDQLQFRLEDTHRLKDAIDGFEENRKRLKKKDLLQYKTLAELEDAVFGEDFEEEEDSYEHNPTEEELIKEKEVKVLLKKAGLRVYVPKTMRASQCFGRGTKWCTASNKTEHNMHDSYSKKGSLYIVIAKGKKYQFHFNQGQFMDARDRPIKDIGALFEANPDLYPVFKKEAIKYGMLNMMDPKDVTDDIACKSFEAACKAEKKNAVPAIRWLQQNFNPHRMGQYTKLRQAMVDWLAGEGEKSRRYFTRSSYDYENNPEIVSWIEDIFTPDDYEAMVPVLGEQRRADNAYIGALLYFQGTNFCERWMLKYKEKVAEEILKFIEDSKTSPHDAFSAQSISAIKVLMNWKIMLFEKFSDDAIRKCARASKNQLSTLLEMGLKLTEEQMMKMIVDDHTIVELLTSPVNAHNVDEKLKNKLTERARMHAKAKAEAGWRR